MNVLIRYTLAHWCMVACAAVSLGVSAPARAGQFKLVVQPILPADQTQQAFQPLADYLTKATNHEIKLVTAINFLSYWEIIKKDDTYDLVLDAAHLTDFRATRMGYKVLAKIPDVVSYTVVTHEKTFILDPRELIGKTVATIGSPSLGAVRLAQLYPNPLRQPVIVEVNNSEEAVQRVLDEKVVAAIIPSPLVGAYPTLNSVFTTDQVPHIALSASPNVPENAQAAISKALVDAASTAEGRAMLEAVNFPAFESTSSATYKGYATLLQGMWGY